MCAVIARKTNVNIVLLLLLSTMMKDFFFFIYLIGAHQQQEQDIGAQQKPRCIGAAAAMVALLTSILFTHKQHLLMSVCSGHRARSAEQHGNMLAHLTSILVVHLLISDSYAGPLCGCEHRYGLLMELYDATNGQQWKNNAGWGAISTCSTDWYGVTCVSGDITEVDLEFNNLQGTLPATWSSMVELHSLTLGINGISGTLPSSWSAMAKLTTLDINKASLLGTLPAAWSTLPDLRHLLLDSNNLSGTLPKSWSNVTSLEHLQLYANSLSGTLPASWSSLSGLLELELGSNSLSGTLPASWSSLSGLEELRLNSNSLNGTLPPSWSGMSALGGLYVQVNCLEGNLPLFSNRSLRVNACNTRVSVPVGQSCSGSGWPSSCVEEPLQPGQPSQRPAPPASTVTRIDAPSHTASPMLWIDRDLDIPPAVPAIAVSTSVASVVSVVSGGDPSSAQVLLLTLNSPCVCADAAHLSTRLPPKALTALSPLLLLLDGDEADPVLAVFGNVVLACTVLIVQICALLAVRAYHRTEGRLCSVLRRPAAMLPEAATVQFPSLAIKTALFLLPGVVWGAVQLHTGLGPAGAPAASTSAGWTVLAVLYVSALGALLECVVFRLWILRFVRFRTSTIFTPPVPKSLAAIVCNREGVWGPPDCRAAFGSPLVASFRPKFHRWAWTVGPLTTLVLAILNTVRPEESSVRHWCDGLQSVVVIILFSAGLLFAVLQPHRVVAASLVCSFGNLHNALLTVLGLLCRHGLVGRESVLIVAAVGTYIVTGAKIVAFCVEQWEKRFLAKKNVGGTGQRTRTVDIEQTTQLGKLIKIICDGHAPFPASTP